MTEPRSYYGRPVIKEPTWTWEIPVYFFTGGLGGASSTLGFAAKLFGNEKLSRTALYLGAAADAGLPAAPHLGSRPAGAVPSHAAGREGDLADEHRRLDPHRPAGRRTPRPCSGCSASCGPSAGRGARRRSLRPAARDVHRRAARRHRGSRVARGAARAAVDLRCERVGFRGRSRVPLPRPGRRGAGAAAGGRQRDRRVGVDADDGDAPRQVGEVYRRALGAGDGATALGATLLASREEPRRPAARSVRGRHVRGASTRPAPARDPACTVGPGERRRRNAEGKAGRPAGARSRDLTVERGRSERASRSPPWRRRSLVADPVADAAGVRGWGRCTRRRPVGRRSPRAADCSSTRTGWTCSRSSASSSEPYSRCGSDCRAVRSCGSARRPTAYSSSSGFPAGSGTPTSSVFSSAAPEGSIARSRFPRSETKKRGLAAARRRYEKGRARARIRTLVRGPPAERARPAGRPRGARRLHVLPHLRPLPPVGRRAGPQPVRVVDARRHRTGDREDPRRHRRHVPADPHPSCDRRAGGRNGRDRCSEAASSSASAAARTSTSTCSATAGRCRTSGSRCSRKPSR